ncbi:hypothetical protein D3C73_965740 [compost metagenome]
MPQAPDAQQANSQEAGRHQHQVGDAHPLHQRTGDDRAEKGADRAGRTDIAVVRPRLRIGEHVGHEAPEHRHRKQVEHGDPEEERHATPRHAAVEQRIEAQQGGDEEAVHRRQEYPPREAADQPAIDRLQHQHDHEDAGKQELQDEVLQRDAMAGEPGDQHRWEHRLQVGRGGHRLAYRAQHVVTAEQAEEVQERPPERRRLAQRCDQLPRRAACPGRAHAAPLASKRRLDSGMAGSGGSGARTLSNALQHRQRGLHRWLQRSVTASPARHLLIRAFVASKIQLFQRDAHSSSLCLCTGEKRR